jgi:hypothetical protein
MAPRRSCIVKARVYSATVYAQAALGDFAQEFQCCAVMTLFLKAMRNSKIYLSLRRWLGLSRLSTKSVASFA